MRGPDAEDAPGAGNADGAIVQTSRKLFEERLANFAKQVMDAVDNRFELEDRATLLSVDEVGIQDGVQQENLAALASRFEQQVIDDAGSWVELDGAGWSCMELYGNG